MNEKKKRIRTVSVNERGQIVIPEDIRKGMGIDSDTTLVLIEQGEEIVLKKESAVLAALDEDIFWKGIAAKSLENAWDKEDAVWDKIARRDGHG